MRVDLFLGLFEVVGVVSVDSSPRLFTLSVLPNVLDRRLNVGVREETVPSVGRFFYLELLNANRPFVMMHGVLALVDRVRLLLAADTSRFHGTQVATS